MSSLSGQYLFSARFLNKINIVKTNLYYKPHLELFLVSAKGKRHTPSKASASLVSQKREDRLRSIDTNRRFPLKRDRPQSRRHLCRFGMWTRSIPPHGRFFFHARLNRNARTGFTIKKKKHAQAPWNERANRQMDGRTCGRTDGQTDGWTVGRAPWAYGNVKAHYGPKIYRRRPGRRTAASNPLINYDRTIVAAAEKRKKSHRRRILVGPVCETLSSVLCTYIRILLYPRYIFIACVHRMRV